MSSVSSPNPSDMSGLEHYPSVFSTPPPSFSSPTSDLDLDTTPGPPAPTPMDSSLSSSTSVLRGGGDGEDELGLRPFWDPKNSSTPSSNGFSNLPSATAACGGVEGGNPGRAGSCTSTPCSSSQSELRSKLVSHTSQVRQCGDGASSSSNSSSWTSS